MEHILSERGKLGQGDAIPMGKEPGSWDPQVPKWERVRMDLAIEDDLVEMKVKSLVTMITIN
jgi:hypothetical protein